MAKVITGQRTTANSSDTKTADQRARAQRTTAKRNQASKPKRSSSSSKSVAIELTDHPFNEGETVEIYERNEADVERREGRAPGADPETTTKIGKDQVFKPTGLKKGKFYYAYAPVSDDRSEGAYLQFRAK